jgi:hypothetical protein
MSLFVFEGFVEGIDGSPKRASCFITLRFYKDHRTPEHLQIPGGDPFDWWYHLVAPKIVILDGATMSGSTLINGFDSALRTLEEAISEKALRLLSAEHTEVKIQRRIFREYL